MMYTLVNDVTQRPIASFRTIAAAIRRATLLRQSGVGVGVVRASTARKWRKR